jgi:predicted methyltransferase
VGDQPHRVVRVQARRKSEVNANPRDTKDYAKGVWTLPPAFELGETEKAKYAAIGESDRMTLKFVKP